LGKDSVECSLILDEDDCETCVRGDTNTFQIVEDSKTPEKLENIRETSRKMIEELCQSAGIPTPEIVFERCSDKRYESCTTTDRVGDTITGKIYLDPYQYSPRALIHEWLHWFKTVKQEDGNNENEVDSMAMSVIDKYFHDVNTTVMGDTHVMGDDSPVPRPESKGIVSGLDGAFAPIAQALHLSPSEVNDVNTPEIIGYSLNALGERFLTPFGSVLTQFLSGLALFGAAYAVPSSDLNRRDRRFVAEIAAHQLWSIIRYADPAVNASTHSQAMAAGNALRSGDMTAFANQLFKDPTFLGVAKTNKVTAASKLASIKTTKPAPVNTLNVRI
jgi:hypothetical protein